MAFFRHGASVRCFTQVLLFISISLYLIISFFFVWVWCLVYLGYHSHHCCHRQTEKVAKRKVEEILNLISRLLGLTPPAPQRITCHRVSPTPVDRKNHLTAIVGNTINRFCACVCVMWHTVQVNWFWIEKVWNNDWGARLNGKLWDGEFGIYFDCLKTKECDLKVLNTKKRKLETMKTFQPLEFNH